MQRWVARLVLLWFVLTVVVLFLESTGRTTIATDGLDYAEAHNLFPLVLAAMACLIAIPFTPRVTLSLSVILLFGPSAAPLVWLAMIAGVMMAFGLGRLAPMSLIQPALRKAGIEERAHAISPRSGLAEAERLKLFFGGHPMMQRVIRWRYAAAAMLLVMPGNIVIGGAGGIGLLTGLTRAFNPLFYALAIAVPFAPVPFAIWLFGIDILTR